MKLKFPLAIIGAQWGDEGKGKMVDIVAEKADYVVRYNGGNNAGHTVNLNGEYFKLSLLPCGVLQKKKLFISQGVVVDPKVLLSEIEFFEKRGMKVNLTIDPRVNIVMPYHKELDAATEAFKGKSATGSLHLGIGYCYEDRNNRDGIRFQDLLDEEILKQKISKILPLKILRIEKVFGQKTNLSLLEIYETYKNYGKELRKYLGDVSLIIQKNLNKKKILFEGAHGTFLDAVFGTYPYTTAVNTISGSIFSYVGLAPQKIYSLGIVKSYTTRVGNGPFMTELFDKTGEKLQAVGQEFGTVSKRKRRCGWLDLVMLRTASRLSGFDYLGITKLDVLSSFSKIKVCTHYKLNGKTFKEMPSVINELEKCIPVYKEFIGWQKDISGVRKFQDLPINAKKYLRFIESELKVPLVFVAVGSERKATIIL